MGQENPEPVKSYLRHEDDLLTAEFKRRTGYDWVKPEEYITYLLAIRRPGLRDHRLAHEGRGWRKLRPECP